VSVVDVGVDRATAAQTTESNMADLRSRIDYEVVAAAAEKRTLDPSELAYARETARAMARGARVDLGGQASLIRGAVRPARLDAGRLNALTMYTPAQRVAMVRLWNLGARFVFDTETVALPRATTGPLAPFGRFRHTTWTADARTANGGGYLGGGKSGTFRCIRCPNLKTAATQTPLSVKTAKDIPDGVAEPGLTFRDGNVYMPPTSGSKPDHFSSHSANPGLATFPWEPYESYESLIVENDFKTTKLMNTDFARVTIPPLFAVYLTPHYHGYHASTQSCHRGFGLFKSSRQYGACFAEAYDGVVYGTCDNAKYPMCAKETAKSASSGYSGAPCTTTGWMPGFGADGVYVPGVLLMNDDAGSEWVVRAGDVVSKRDVMACDKRTMLSSVRAPSVVNCAAAWNYAVCPHYGVVRSHTDPWSGDQAPILDAVGDVACASRELFVSYHATLGIIVTFRSDLA
jgi:hypothetical protein